MSHFLIVMALVSVPFLALFGVWYFSHTFGWIREHWYGFSASLMSLAACVMFKAASSYGPGLPDSLSNMALFQYVLAVLFVINWRMHTGPVLRRF